MREGLVSYRGVLLPDRTMHKNYPAAQNDQDWHNLRVIRRVGNVQMGENSSADLTTSTRRFIPEGWIAWLVVMLGVLTAGVSLYAMAESIMMTQGAATQFWDVVGRTQQQVRI